MTRVPFIYGLLLLGAFIPVRALAQEPSANEDVLARQVVFALLSNGALDIWEESLAGREEPVEAEVELMFRTDSTGSVERVEIVSAPFVNAEVQERILAVVRGLVVSERPRYDGHLAFTLRYGPSEARALSPVTRGVLVGVVLGLTALFLALLA